MGKKTLADIKGSIKRETEKAYLFSSLYEDKEVWLPKSMCEWDEDSKEMTMPEWLAIERELV
jgi:hypothetical protein